MASIVVPERLTFALEGSGHLFALIRQNVANNNAAPQPDQRCGVSLLEIFYCGVETFFDRFVLFSVPTEDFPTSSFANALAL